MRREVAVAQVEIEDVNLERTVVKKFNKGLKKIKKKEIKDPPNRAKCLD